MASLVVRKIDDAIVRSLKERAKRHGRSAEAEHRLILERALSPQQTSAEMWARLRAIAGGAGEGVDFETLADQQVEPAVFD